MIFFIEGHLNAANKNYVLGCLSKFDSEGWKISKAMN